MNSEGRPPPLKEGDIEALVNAFHYFNEATANLNLAYHRLEERLSELDRQLEAKDRELYGRLRELDRVSKFLSSLVESLSSGVAAIDLDGRITIFNRAAAEMIGIPAEDVIGKSYAEMLASDDGQGGALATLLNGPEQRGVERTLPSGARVLSRTVWVVDSMGERVGVMELLDDITSIRLLEEQAQRQKTLAAMGEMASGVAHELRNPLAGIAGFAGILKKELKDDERLFRMAERIVQGVENLDRVATNLLFLTKQTTVKLESLDVGCLISDACALLQAESSRSGKNVVITAHIPREKVPVWADPMLLQIIFGNLGKNALQAVCEGGEVNIRLTWQLLANRVEVEVMDNGSGISPENLDKIFFRFSPLNHPAPDWVWRW